MQQARRQAGKKGQLQQQPEGQQQQVKWRSAPPLRVEGDEKIEIGPEAHLPCRLASECRRDLICSWLKQRTHNRIVVGSIDAPSIQAAP